MTCWAELLSRWSLVSGSNLYECHCELTEIVGHFFIMLHHHRGIKSSFIYYGNEFSMLIILKQREKKVLVFFFFDVQQTNSWG